MRKYCTENENEKRSKKTLRKERNREKLQSNRIMMAHLPDKQTCKSCSMWRNLQASDSPTREWKYLTCSESEASNKRHVRWERERKSTTGLFFLRSNCSSTSEYESRPCPCKLIKTFHRVTPEFRIRTQAWRIRVRQRSDMSAHCITNHTQK